MNLRQHTIAAVIASAVSVSAIAVSPADRPAPGPWSDYLLHRITPDLERLSEQAVPRTGWLRMDDTLIAPDFASALLSPGEPMMMFTLDRGRSELTMGPQGRHLGTQGISFQQSLLMPGLTSEINPSTSVTVSAVLASQRYGNSGLNLMESDNAVVAENAVFSRPFGAPEVAHGAGLRLGLMSDIGTQWTFEAAFQSRIDMAEFATLRGLYGTVAELDIPSRLQAGMQFHATSRSSLRFGIEQIFYGEVGAFPSRALPARFTALLGDSTSPRFAWDDLVVYSLGWQWTNGHDLAFYIDYQTRTQPKPTASVLADALEPELADNALLAGLSKGLGRYASLRLSASYAPPEFAFGGNVLGIVSDRLDQDIEVQAMVEFDF
ncbi:hypothetical protein [Wenzhouxiangella marina]|uniref:Uncharacterized protein n=1 Tax=Wenzhouxiangella marina TaxID=1579979 RepID=A0A0K0XXQ4_9GAMM|nr:hypothetical protein [Wenzhouxiangella marina]AKS42391.1 hypothetical protein WM2015_2026 [Wenzhouxiangella marina]MBB6085835.1 long-chain fatty acid transport protein [Wenzhouxiangella marina]